MKRMTKIMVIALALIASALFVAPAAAADANITGLQVVNYNATYVNMTWTVDNLTATHGAIALSNTTLEWSNDNFATVTSGGIQTAPFDQKLSNFTITTPALTLGTEYQFRVKAFYNVTTIGDNGVKYSDAITHTTPAVDPAVAKNSTIFVYETGLDLRPFSSIVLEGSPDNAKVINKLVAYVDDQTNKGERNSITINTAAKTKSFDVIEPEVGGEYGLYYVFIDNVRTNDYVYIRKPSLTTDIVLAGDHSSSVDGKSITKNTKIQFRVDAPHVGADFKRGSGTNNEATVKVELTTPDGGKVTTFGTEDLSKIDVTDTRIFTNNLTLTNEAAGTYTAVVKWASPSGFADYAATSNTASFTIDTRTVSITSDKENVIRNNNFVVTISGESQKDYYVYVQSAPASDKTPYVRTGQPSVTVSDGVRAELAALSPSNYNNITGASAKVRTNAAGTRPVEFVTNATTEEKTYTIRVISDDNSKYDTVKVKVEKGSITITASGDRTYYIGEEITFSGTNTDSDTVYLFVTGPNLESKDGVKADAPSTKTVTGDETTFKTVSVESDDTWEWKFDTQGYAVDAGTYTYYAVTADKNRANLADAQYATISVVLRKGFVSSSASSTTVAKGDKLFIRGNAQGNPNDVAIWIIGTNHLVRASESVDDDSSFEYELKSEATKDLAAGQYFVIVQHPMGDGKFNVVKDDVSNRVSILDTNGLGTNGFIYKGDGRLQGSDAAQALIDLLNNQNVDDTYNKLTFLVQEPWIRIDTISDKYVGTTFTITGTTNLGVDNEILVDVKSSAFQPTDKTASGEFSGDAGNVKVVAGDAGYNTWSFDVNAAAFKADEYIVKVESIESDTTATATFNVLEGVPVTQPPATPVPTTPPATQPPATQPPATPASPGFGALVAIAGLGAVAFLVLRRD